MDIGLFQLENLIVTRTKFVFLDLRERVETSAELKSILNEAVRVATGEIEKYLKENQIPQAAPIVLLCEKGKASSKAARQLEALGYTQVYVVTRGEAGLLSEL